MFFISKRLPFLILLNLIFIVCCTTHTHNKSEVETAMMHYDNLILTLDADSISNLFTPDGELGDIAIGRDSIKKFLSTFKNVRVLTQSSITKSIDIIGDTAIQKGIYTQTDIASEKDTIKVKGEYTARWEWIRKEGWHIKRMTTKATN